MEKEVSWNVETQETIGLIPLVVPFNFLYFYIGISLNFHGNSKEASTQQNIHLSLPFKNVEWSQDDPLRLIHISTIVPFNQQNVLPYSDVEPTIAIWKENNRTTKDLIPCGN